MRTSELRLTPTVPELDPLTELMDAPAVNYEDIAPVLRLSDLRLTDDVLMGIEREVNFLRVRSIESEVAVT